MHEREVRDMVGVGHSSLVSSRQTDERKLSLGTGQARAPRGRPTLWECAVHDDAKPAFSTSEAKAILEYFGELGDKSPLDALLMKWYTGDIGSKELCQRLLILGEAYTEKMERERRLDAETRGRE